MPDLQVRTKDGSGTITLRSGDDDFTSAGIEDSSSSLDSIEVPTPNTSQSLVGSLTDSNAIKMFDSKVNLALAKSKVTIDTINAKTLIEQNEILKAQLSNSAITAYVLDTQSILLSEVIGELATLNTNITKQIEAIKNSSGSNNVSVNVDTTELTLANQKIAEGVEDQIATNQKLVESLTKKNEHLDYLKDGHDTLKDSAGNKIIPRDIQAKKDAEIHMDKESINKTTIDEIMEFNQDVRQFLDGNSPEALFSDAVGATDGFVDDLNPLKHLLKYVLDAHEKEINPNYQVKEDL